MPVRKIPKNYLSVTGSFSSAKNGKSLGHEFLLERDLMILLEFDDTVERFEEQPVKIPFKKGIKPYVPDILIHYLPNSFGETRQGAMRRADWIEYKAPILAVVRFGICIQALRTIRHSPLP